MQQTAQESHAIQRRTLRVRAGFAALFFSYFIVSFLLMYTMTLMTRSFTEMRGAERAAGLQQAFWAAEGELETVVANLRLNTPPLLAAGVCQDNYTTRTLSSSLSSKSKICGTSATNNYVVEATGTSGSATRVVSTVITYQADTLQFNQVALTQRTQFSGYTTGSVENGFARAVTASSVEDNSADVATTESKPMYYFHDDNPNNSDCEEGVKSVPWISATSSQIRGRVLVGPEGDPSDEKMVYLGRAGGGPTDGRSQVQGRDTLSASQLPTLPKVDVPDQAVDLGALTVGQTTVTDASAAGRLCLSSGIYKASSVSLAMDSELCTVGPVSLYVTGGSDSNSVWLAPGAQLYGQPKTVLQGEGSHQQTVTVQPYAKVYAPENLRLFVKGSNSVWLGQNGSLTAAVVYAPEATVIAPVSSTLLGSVTAWEFVQGPPVPWSGQENFGLSNYLIYDRSLQGKSIPVGPVTVSVKMWGAGVTAEQELAKFIQGTAATSRTTSADSQPGQWPGNWAQQMHAQALLGLSAVQSDLGACHSSVAAVADAATAATAASTAESAAQTAQRTGSVTAARGAADHAEAAAQAAATAAQSAATNAAAGQLSSQTEIAANATQAATDAANASARAQAAAVAARTAANQLASRQPGSGGNSGSPGGGSGH